MLATIAAAAITSTYSAAGHVANQALKQTCTMDSGRKCKPGYMPIHPIHVPIPLDPPCRRRALAVGTVGWKKNGTGGDVQLAAHEHVAPWAAGRLRSHWETALPGCSSWQGDAGLLLLHHG